MLMSLLSLIAVNNLTSPSEQDIQSKLADFAITPPLIQEVSPYPQKITNNKGPIIDAKAIYSFDLATGKTLFAQNENEKLPMASLTKLMTILIILENHQINDIVTVDPRSTQIEPAKMNLLANEQILLKELIKGMIVKSANDAALAAAFYDSQDMEEFADKMNKKAIELEMFNTHYINSTGFDEDEQYTTAYDLSLLVRQIYKYPLIKEYAILSEGVSESIDGKFQHKYNATNGILNSYLKVLGLKTGTTDLAGQCFISIVESPSGNKIVNILLNSPNRFNESKVLSQWIFDNYQWQ